MVKRAKKTGGSSPTKKQRIADEIKKWSNADGSVSPKKIWRNAKADPTSTCHGEFNWDLQKAAEETWTRRAAELIREVRVMITMKSVGNVSASFYTSEKKKSGETAYSPTLEIAKSTTRSRRAIQEEITRIKSAIHRAIILASVFNLRAEFEQMLDDVVDIEKRI